MFTINNVKISCKIPETPLSKIEAICYKENIKFNLYKNFIVFRTQGFTYTLFKKKVESTFLKDCKKTQHVNVTKCLFHNISHALDTLATLISCDRSSIGYIIDTITATGDIGYSLDLNSIVIANFGIADKLLYNPEKFPGVFLSNRSSAKTIIFKSGKYVIVGARTNKEIQEIQEWMLSRIALIQQH